MISSASANLSSVVSCHVPGYSSCFRQRAGRQSSRDAAPGCRRRPSCRATSDGYADGARPHELPLPLLSPRPRRAVTRRRELTVKQAKAQAGYKFHQCYTCNLRHTGGARRGKKNPRDSTRSSISAKRGASVWYAREVRPRMPNQRFIDLLAPTRPFLAKV
jgi:hypothetical protein